MFLGFLVQPVLGICSALQRFNTAPGFPDESGVKTSGSIFLPKFLKKKLHELKEMYMHLHQVRIRLPTLALKLRGDVNRSPKE